MPNTFFRFRQFTVNQDKCAMKVCTDACLFGAWIASGLNNGNEQLLLDIGSGTGLLSLIIAQKTSGTIHAVEIDDQANTQASENFQSSPWPNRLANSHSSIQSFNPGYQFDFIFSNPPFFENDLKADNDQKNLALHSTSLNLDDLLGSVKRLLKPGGEFAILLPFRRSDYFESVLNELGFYLIEKITVKPTPDHNAFRCMYLLTNRPFDSIASFSEIIIKSDSNHYTKEFYELLKDYYLFEKSNLEI